jgi:hypothetical protein
MTLRSRVTSENPLTPPLVEAGARISANPRFARRLILLKLRDD